MKEITPKKIEQLLNSKDNLNIIDVRETEEVKAGKMPNAINIPLGLLEFRMHELDKAKEYIMVCRSGGRSFKGSQLLESHGFHVINMAGGMLEWEGPTE
ncbi:rhodanese-like domain-containing protein [Fictibacillus fluitans]|uniref:Rhodanese-like domain-containing protein n=1 Tax=Fictibacillus fluitans TaxID=3058422 RepID=A0ABT8I1U5_9BACL|nr:rhodanese-like domain-containing protein [Fictibacillus sp. NE201]MDN4527008.1 rhodanese-like domain-containing protein [Fictibacillus sp. NE201]